MPHNPLHHLNDLLILLSLNTIPAHLDFLGLQTSGVDAHEIVNFPHRHHVPAMAWNPQ